jgi:hypothetical protein
MVPQWGIIFYKLKNAFEKVIELLKFRNW